MVNEKTHYNAPTAILTLLCLLAKPILYHKGLQFTNTTHAIDPQC